MERPVITRLASVVHIPPLGAGVHAAGIIGVSEATKTHGLKPHSLLHDSNVARRLHSRCLIRRRRAGWTRSDDLLDDVWLTLGLTLVSDHCHLRSLGILTQDLHLATTTPQ